MFEHVQKYAQCVRESLLVLDIFNDLFAWLVSFGGLASNKQRKEGANP